MFPRSFGNEEFQETISKGQLNLPKCKHHLSFSTEFVEDI